MIGETPDKKFLQKITAVLESIDPDLQAHHYHLHRYGDHVELTFHLTMAPELTLKQAHDRANSIEQDLRKTLGIEATIHMEPHGEKHAHN